MKRKARESNEVGVNVSAEYTGTRKRVKISGIASTLSQLANSSNPHPPTEPTASTSTESATAAPAPNIPASTGPTRTEKKKHRIQKLAPPRPYPTVPLSQSATGPRRAHKEGKNLICVTRKTGLGAYLRRCKDLVVKDGYETIHLNAMGAAIPHLLQLAAALPPILPFGSDEVKLEVQTGTVEVRDELVPDDEDEDIEYRTRGKSSLAVVIRLGQTAKQNSEPGEKGVSKGADAGKESGKGADIEMVEDVGQPIAENV